GIAFGGIGLGGIALALPSVLATTTGGATTIWAGFSTGAGFCTATGGAGSGAGASASTTAGSAGFAGRRAASTAPAPIVTLPLKSEERRVGKECRCRWSP